ncbi:MAG: Gfo/Idh/MocA family oxidoreductase [Chloroflexi bacterium]|nr:Gfo/Idh/MocA family oxidoreductase [Chloroflexota bacterium]
MVLRVGVVGCGHQGREHLKHYRRRDDVRLAAVCDVDRWRAEAARNDFQAERSFVDYREMLESCSLDLVSVCTYPATHHDITVAALARGAHVLCEKPLARDCAEASGMARAAQEARRLLTVGTNMRYMGVSQAIQRYVENGSLGRPIYGRAWILHPHIPWFGPHYVQAISGGGALATTAVHALDLAVWLAGDPEPVAVTASTARLFPHKRASSAPNGEAARAYDVEDHVAALIRFQRGFTLTLEGAWAADCEKTEIGLTIVGERATVHFDPFRIVGEGEVVDLTPAETPDRDWSASIGREIDDLVQAIRRERSPLITLDQALKVQRLVDAIYLSAERGQEIVLGEEARSLATKASRGSGDGAVATANGDASSDR